MCPMDELFAYVLGVALYQYVVNLNEGAGVFVVSGGGGGGMRGGGMRGGGNVAFSGVLLIVIPDLRVLTDDDFNAGADVNLGEEGCA